MCPKDWVDPLLAVLSQVHPHHSVFPHRPRGRQDRGGYVDNQRKGRNTRHEGSLPRELGSPEGRVSRGRFAAGLCSTSLSSLSSIVRVEDRLRLELRGAWTLEGWSTYSSEESSSSSSDSRPLAESASGEFSDGTREGMTSCNRGGFLVRSCTTWDAAELLM